MTTLGSSPHRILYVETNEDGTVGGSYRALEDLVRGLDRARFTPQVVLYQESSAGDALRAAGADVRIWSAARAIERAYSGPQRPWRRIQGLTAAIRRRTRWLQAEGISLVHLNNSPGVGFDDWLPAARLAGTPCITHLRGPFARARGTIGRALQQRFTRVLPVSRWMAESALAAGIPAARIRIVHDGVDRRAIQAALRTPPLTVRGELGLAADDFVVLLAGHLRPWKGQHVALDALARIDAPRRRTLRMLFAGASSPEEAGYREALEAKVRADGLGACVRFLGARADLPDLMRASDLVLHASTRPEPFGLVVVEAMALGRPVLASKFGGPAEIVTEGSGLLFDPSHGDELPFLLAHLAEQPALRAALGAGALRRVEAFDVGHTVAAVERCYGELLGAPSRRSDGTPETEAARRETRATIDDATR